MKKQPAVISELCPNCGNEIQTAASPGEIRKCPYCRRRYVVKYEKRNRRYLEAYIRITGSGDDSGDAGTIQAAETGGNLYQMRPSEDRQQAAV